jgi:branched-chain amino acid transport system permease protein
MTELQAERAAESLGVPRVEARSKRLRYLDVLIAVAAFAVLAALPFLFSSKALLDFVIRCSAFGLFATSLNLLVGYTGMISFGHGMFFGLGAYGFGLIMQRTGVPIPVAFIGTLLITAIVSAVIGAICVRLKEIYFAFVTLAFQMLIHSLILSWVSLTGGDQGLRGGIPRPVFLGVDLSNHMHLYVVSCALLVIGLLLMRQIAQSPFGYTLRMIRDNASRASFIGIDVWRAKLTIFVLAALVASHASWRWAFVLLGTLNLLGALAIRAWLPAGKRFIETGRECPVRGKFTMKVELVPSPSKRRPGPSAASQMPASLRTGRSQRTCGFDATKTGP